MFRVRSIGRQQHRCTMDSANSTPETSLLRRLVKDLEEKRANIRRLGGEEKIARQHARAKLTCRERLDRFFDDGLYFEVGAHGTQMGLASGPNGDDKPAADGVVTVFGRA